MIDLIETAREIQNFCDERNWRFCFIGGIALQFWGEQRLTKDVDLTLLTGFGAEEEFIDALILKYPARLEDAKDFALKSRVLLLKTVGGIGIDISLGAFDFERSMMDRAEYQEYLPDISLKICSPDDLIVLKAFANRDKDWNDIETVCIRQKNLDWDYIKTQLAPLADLNETPEVLLKLDNLRRKISK